MVLHCTLDDAYGTNRCTEVLLYWKLYCYKLCILCFVLFWDRFSHTPQAWGTHFLFRLRQVLIFKRQLFFQKKSPCFCRKKSYYWQKMIFWWQYPLSSYSQVSSSCVDGSQISTYSWLYWPVPGSTAFKKNFTCISFHLHSLVVDPTWIFNSFLPILEIREKSIS